VLASGFDAAQVQQVLWHEVFPALADNLRIIAGEWGVFDDRWLRQRIVDVMTGAVPGASGPGGLITLAQVRKITEASWAEVCVHLPPDYRLARPAT
jgi:hypothetical protein